MDKKEYLKHYRNSPENKERHNARNRDAYNSEDGLVKEGKRRRTVEVRYSKARYDAGRRSSGAKEFTLSLEEYRAIVCNPCYYCEEDISEGTGSGLDRVDNSLGYTFENCKPCCSSCNRRRGKSMSSAEFLRQSILNRKPKE